MKGEACWDERWMDLSRQPPILLRQINYLHHRYMKLFPCVLPSSKGLRLLEVGSCTGKFLVYFGKELCYDVWGLDISIQLAALTKRNLHSTGTEGTVVCGDLFHSCFETGSFDIVFSSSTIEHFNDTPRVIGIMAETLKPGGVLVSIVPNLVGINGMILKVVAPSKYYGHRLLTPEEMRQHHESAGLRVVLNQYFGSFKIGFGSFLELRAVAGRCGPLITAPIRGLNAAMGLVLRVLHAQPESRLFSPVVLCIAEKPR